MAALEKCRGCAPHRNLSEALAELARIYYEQESFDRLVDVVEQQLRTAVVWTPRMHMMHAEALREKAPEAARRIVDLGLDLPGAGFTAEVERLHELRAELQKK